MKQRLGWNAFALGIFCQPLAHGFHEQQFIHNLPN